MKVCFSCLTSFFYIDKEIDILNETERIRRQIRQEKEVQNQLIAEITALKSQLEESKQGLQAASRLSEQLEKSKQQVLAMKDEGLYYSFILHVILHYSFYYYFFVMKILNYFHKFWKFV